MTRPSLGPILSALLPCSLALTACDPGAPSPDPGAPVVDSGDTFARVHTGYRVPTTATQALADATDLDGDGVLDNRLGTFLATLQDQGIDVRAANAQAQTRGAIMRYTLRADSLVDDDSVSFTVGLGPDGAIGGGELVGAIRAGRLDAGFGDVAIYLPVFPGEPPVELPLTDARVQMTVDAGACSGVVRGAITQRDLDELVIPSLAETFTRYAAAHPELQVATVTWWDANEDGRIDAAEVQKSDLVRAMLAPDLDSDGDAARDSLSVALPFSCAAPLAPVPAPARNQPVAQPSPPLGS